VPEPLGVPAALSAWQAAPFIDAGLIIVAACYLAGSWRVWRRHPVRPWPAARTLAFLAGLAIVAVATQGSVAVYDDVLFSAHMVQHVLLIMVAPPLLVFGRPLTLLLHTAGNPVHTWVKRVLRTPAARALTWPVGTTVAYVAVVAVTHTPPVMDLVLRSDLAHGAEHLLYLVAGYLFFLPIVGAEPIRWRISMPARFLMLLVGMQADTLVGVALLIQGREVFTGYGRAGRSLGVDPVADLHRGGVIMFVGSDVVMALLAVAVCVAMVHDRRWAGRVGGWVEGLRRASLLRQVTAAGLSLPGGPRSGRTIDDDAHLAAYNAYLARLGDRGQVRPEGSGLPGGPRGPA
jgi:cytochrome c oxidase assembly factor CtaG